MKENFLLFNKHLENPEQFAEVDPQLSKLKQFRYVNRSKLLEKFPTTPGIYSLVGGGQVGKTTLLKQWIKELLAKGIPAKAITFFSGELIDSYQTLISVLQTQLMNKTSDTIHYLLLDDITDVSGWEKAIKFSADTGLLDHVIVMLASSDRALSTKLQTDFANRQNETPIDHFNLYPLSFHECVALKNQEVEVEDINLYEEFNQYLLHGGYLIAMNDMAIHGKILDATLKVYADWLYKEIVNHDKQESFMREILAIIIEHYLVPITWNGLTHELSIHHPKTIGDYIDLLESLDSVFVQYALLEERLNKAPKKARKLMFSDPFVFHSIRWLLNPVENSFEALIKPLFDHAEWYAKIVEACTITQFRRYYPTFYIKAEGEINLAYIFNERFWPILMTWTNQLRAKDLKQILKYPNGKILTKSRRSGIIEHVRTEPLPQALWKLYIEGNHV